MSISAHMPAARRSVLYRFPNACAFVLAAVLALLGSVVVLSSPWMAWASESQPAQMEIQATTSPALVLQPDSVLAPQAEAAGTPMYRLYSPYTSEHLFTASKDERANLMKSAWHYEGLAWMNPESGSPVYRLYSPSLGQHHYTTSAEERDWLAQNWWNYEGVGWYSTESGGSPVYRLYSRALGWHHYTMDVNERNWLLMNGWTDEGVGWKDNSVPANYQDDAEVWKPRISGDSALDTQIEILLLSHPSLRSCYDYVSGFGYINGNRFYGGEHFLDDATTISYAKEMLANGGGNCYRYASLFSWLARGLGYNTAVVSGWVPSYSGGRAPHGWVEVYTNGQTWVCDPDMNHAIPSRNWYMFSYSNPPTSYGSW